MELKDSNKVEFKPFSLVIKSQVEMDVLYTLANLQEDIIDHAIGAGCDLKNASGKHIVRHSDIREVLTDLYDLITEYEK